MQKSSINVRGKEIPYVYIKKGNEIAYAEIEGNVITKKDNKIFVNGIKVATCNTTVRHVKNEAVGMSRTGWMWTDNGNQSDYENSFDTKERNIALEKTLATFSIATLALVIVAVFPSGFMEVEQAKGLANIIISGVSGAYIAYANATSFYCVERHYKHKYIPYSKMVKARFYYDRQYRDEVPNSGTVRFGSWG